MNVRASALFAIMLAAPSIVAAAPQAGPSSLALPGTGVRIVPPNGTRLAPAGPILIDEAGETIIIIGMTDAKLNLENNATYRALYKRPPERVSTRELSGNLYRRTRVADGGAWDGWFFAVARGQKALNVMVSYTGSSAPAFDRLREHLLTISWDESVADPELALGVKLRPQGLRLVSGAFGGVSYNETGQLGAAGPALLIQAIPISTAKANAVFPSGCEQILSAAFDGKPFVGPAVREHKGVHLCETWSKTPESEMRYIALVRLPNGALLNAMGTTPSSRFQQFLPVFRSALETLQPLSAR